MRIPCDEYKVRVIQTLNVEGQEFDEHDDGQEQADEELVFEESERVEDTGFVLEGGETQGEVGQEHDHHEGDADDLAGEFEVAEVE